MKRNVKTAECVACDTLLAKNDDARRERDGKVVYYCDKCLAKLARGVDPSV
jgi:RNase P subunit RPR2